jgi:hypothetical protein
MLQIIFDGFHRTSTRSRNAVYSAIGFVFRVVQTALVVLAKTEPATSRFSS